MVLGPSEAFGVVPTLMVLAKALGFGLPLVAVTGRAEVIDALPVAGGTLGGIQLLAPHR